MGGVAVNDGTYRASTAILSLGVSFAFDVLGRSQRIVRYRSEWEEERRSPPRPSVPGPAGGVANERAADEVTVVAAAQSLEVAPIEPPVAASASDGSDGGFVPDLVTHSARPEPVTPRRPARRHRLADRRHHGRAHR
jgi:hypothetical protein